LTLNILIIKF